MYVHDGMIKPLRASILSYVTRGGAVVYASMYV